MSQSLYFNNKCYVICILDPGSQEGSNLLDLIDITKDLQINGNFSFI